MRIKVTKKLAIVDIKCRKTLSGMENLPTLKIQFIRAKRKQNREISDRPLKLNTGMVWVRDPSCAAIANANAVISE